MSARKLLPHVVTLTAAVALIVTQQAWAAPLLNRLASPSATSKTTIAYQGYLTDSAGAPVNETLAMVFKLYNVESGGAPLWTETQPTVGVSQGVFSVLLGSVTSLSAAIIANNSDLWLGVTIGSDEEMAPRDKIASAPYAMMADVPDGSITQAKLAGDSVTSDKVVDGQVNTADLAAAAVTTAKLADDAVTSAKVQDGQVAAADLAAAAVTTAKLADNAVTSGKIQDGQVGAVDLADAAVTSAKLADNVVTSAKIVDGTIGSVDVGFSYAGSASKGGAASDLACANCVSSGEIVDGDVRTADIRDANATSRKVHLTSGHVAASFTDLNTTWKTINGSTATFTAETSSNVLIASACELQINNLDVLAEVQVVVNGYVLPGSIVAGNEPPYGPSNLLYKWRGTVGMNHLLTVGAGSNTIYLQGRTNTGGAHAWRCNYSYIVFAANP